MWRSREKPSPNNIQRTFSKSFSFKDIESLCSDDHTTTTHPQPDPSTNPTSSLKPTHTNKPSIFHRVLRTNSILRAFSIPPCSPVPQPSPPNNAESDQSQPSISIPVAASISAPLPEPSPSISIPVASSLSAPPLEPSPSISIPGAEKRIIVYLTSLRVIRSTFEACRTVQSILRGLRVTVDERDLSMDPTFTEELQRIFKIEQKTQLTLPRVFIGGRYIGGAEEVWQLNETGELKRLVEGLPAAELGICEECGGYRFILCDECSGSHKVYTEKTGGFRMCTVCNENGLIRCPSCSCDPI